MHSLAFLGNLFQVDGLIILIIGLLIFGKRLPEVGRSLGQTIVEFKKGLSGVGGGATKESTTPEQTDEQPIKRISSPTVAASTPARKSLPTTEEI